MAEYTIPLGSGDTTCFVNSTVYLYYGLSRPFGLTDTTHMNIRVNKNTRVAYFGHPAQLEHVNPGIPVRVVHEDILVIDGIRYMVWCPADWKQRFPGLRLV